MHTLILPESFFSTETILEIHSAYRQDRINQWPRTYRSSMTDSVQSFPATSLHLTGLTCYIDRSDRLALCADLVADRTGLDIRSDRSRLSCLMHSFYLQ